MAQSSVTAPRYTLVLGGSTGIGFAFAEWCAAKGRRLILVGRHRPKLTRARNHLIEVGATEVTLRNGDLLDLEFRAKLLDWLNRKHLSTVFIGGPTPPQLDPSGSTWLEAQRAVETCIVYPVHIFGALLKNTSWETEVIFLSSSAAREKLEGHPFFWSAAIRPAAEKILTALARNRRDRRIKVAVWRPKVVDTDLARRYSTFLPPCGKNDSLTNRLKRQFGVSRLLTPREYVLQMMRGRDE
jgi:short-subunit dehydrogenase